MTDKELKRLNRAELLELLLEQMRENERLKAENAGQAAELEERRLKMDRCGTLAEAALQLNSVFANADAAAAQYLENIREASDRADSACGTLIAEAKARAGRIVEEAKERAAAIETEAEEKKQNAQAEADAYWQKVSQKLESFYEEHQGLRELLRFNG